MRHRGLVSLPFVRVLIVTLAAAAWASGAAAGGNFGDDLVGWWKFDECDGLLFDDASGHGNDGTLTNQVGFTADGLRGCALEFTGLSRNATVLHSFSLEPVHGTIEAWVRVPHQQNAEIVHKTTDLFVRRNWPGGFSVYILRIWTDGSVQGVVGNDDLDMPSPWTFATTEPNVIVPGSWQHLAMRWDGSELAVFVDGTVRVVAPYDPVPGSGLSYHGQIPFYLGRISDWGGLIGQIDDVRFYARARRNQEIFTDFITKGRKPARPPGQ